MSNHERTTERPYLSIGEVLGLLLGEFPDVTISKIRFLESQGLIEPERTASGYRKFYDADVERLRFILREQRENYLPLKVIRDRLEGETPTSGISRPEPASAPTAGERAAPHGTATSDATADTTADTTAVMTRPQVEAADAQATATPSSPSTPAANSATPATPATPAVAAAPRPAASDAGERPSDADVRSHPAGSVPLPGAAATPALDLDAAAATAAESADGQTPPAETAVATPAAPAPAAPPPPAAPVSGQFSRPELLTATGIEGRLLDELESYGLVSSRVIGQQAVYDGAARQICELAGAFHQLGIEVRHLRAWKSSAEREAGLFEQRILPLLRQRNPSAREQSLALLEQMTTLGANLRHALVAQALRQYLTD